jgi:hypothetical protein
MADGGDERESPPSGRPGPARLGRRAGGVTRSIWLLEHAQDLVTVGTGGVLIVGLVAVIRKILFVLTGEKQLGTSVLALLIAMVAVFITGLVVVSRFERSVEPDLAGRCRVWHNPCSGNVHRSNACANGRKCAMLRLGGQRQQRLTTQVSGSTTAHALARCCKKTVTGRVRPAPASG